MSMTEALEDFCSPRKYNRDLAVHAVADSVDLLVEIERLRKALEIQQDESDLQMQGYRLCDDPNHPLFVKWLGPAKEGDTGFERHRQMSALRRSMRIAALAPPAKEVPSE